MGDEEHEYDLSGSVQRHNEIIVAVCKIHSNDDSDVQISVNVLVLLRRQKLLAFCLL